MNAQQKREKIKELTLTMLRQSYETMCKKVDTAVQTLNTDNWDENENPMILPRCVVVAILENEPLQHNGTGTCFEKEMKKEVKIIRYHL
jgi:hypothetical protein